METKSIKVEVTEKQHKELVRIQENIRKQTGKKVALSIILLKFALKGMECSRFEANQSEIVQNKIDFAQNKNSFEQNLTGIEQNEIVSLQNLNKFVQNEKDISSKIEKAQTKTLLDNVMLLKNLWEERFVLFEDMQRYLEQREYFLERKQHQLSEKEYELESKLHQQIEDKIKLGSCEAELERLRQDKEQQKAELHDLIEKLNNIDAMKDILRDNKTLLDRIFDMEEKVLNLLDNMSLKLKDNNDFLDKIIGLLPTAILVYDKLNPDNKQKQKQGETE